MGFLGQIQGYFKLLIDSLVKNTRVIRPATGNPVTLTATTTTWQQGTKVEVVDDTGTKTVVLHGISVMEVSASIHRVKLYTGDSGSEVEITGSEVPVHGVGYYPFPFPLYVAGNSLRISASTGSKGTTADTLSVILHYHQLG